MDTCTLTPDGRLRRGGRRHDDSDAAVKVELMESRPSGRGRGSRGEETELAALDGLIGLTENGARRGHPPREA